MMRHRWRRCLGIVCSDVIGTVLSLNRGLFVRIPSRQLSCQLEKSSLLQEQIHVQRQIVMFFSLSQQWDLRSWKICPAVLCWPSLNFTVWWRANRRRLKLWRDRCRTYRRIGGSSAHRSRTSPVLSLFMSVEGFQMKRLEKFIGKCLSEHKLKLTGLFMFKHLLCYCYCIIVINFCEWVLNNYVLGIQCFYKIIVLLLSLLLVVR